MEMTKKFYLETLKSVLGCFIFCYFKRKWQAILSFHFKEIATRKTTFSEKADG